MKTLDSSFKSEIAKLKKQVEDLGQGKITPIEELERIGNATALVD